MAKPFLRDPFKERFWRRMLTQWRRSRLTIRAFCAGQQLAEANFYAWRRTLQLRDHDNTSTKTRRCRQPHSKQPVATPRPAKQPPAFLPVRVLPEPTAARSRASDIEVCLGNGRRLLVRPGFDTVTLQQLLTVLEGQPC